MLQLQDGMLWDGMLQFQDGMLRDGMLQAVPQVKEAHSTS